MKNLILALLFIVLESVAAARGFRQFNPIASPNVRLPKGAKPVAEVVPIPPEAVRDAVRQVLSKWNENDLDKHLDENFYDRQRLLDNLAADVPRDARIRVLSVRNVRPLQQYITPAATPGGKPTLSSIVSVTAQTQIEYHDAERGFQRRPGINDMILRIEMEPEE